LRPALALGESAASVNPNANGIARTRRSAAALLREEKAARAVTGRLISATAGS